MEATIGFGFLGCWVLGFEVLGLYWDDGKQNGYYYKYSILGLCWDDGK